MTDGGDDTVFFLCDGLGSTTGLTDEAGDEIADYEYDVFGTVRAHTGASTEFSFTGEQNDASGLEYLRARYYEPATGRFLSRDPLGLPQAYTYTSSNPMTFVDPRGLDADDPVPFPAPVSPEAIEKCGVDLDECNSYGGSLGLLDAHFICMKYYVECVGTNEHPEHATGNFRTKAARRELERIASAESRSRLGTAIDSIGATSIDIINALRDLPNTGSGGYLGSPKESVFLNARRPCSYVMNSNWPR